MPQLADIVGVNEPHVTESVGIRLEDLFAPLTTRGSSFIVDSSGAGQA